MTTYGLVNSSIGATADEANNFVAVNHPDLALVTNIRPQASIRRICWISVEFMRVMSKHTKGRSSSSKHDDVLGKTKLVWRLSMTAEKGIMQSSRPEITRLKGKKDPNKKKERRRRGDKSSTIKSLLNAPL